MDYAHDEYHMKTSWKYVQPVEIIDQVNCKQGKCGYVQISPKRCCCYNTCHRFFCYARKSKKRNLKETTLVDL